MCDHKDNEKNRKVHTGNRRIKWQFFFLSKEICTCPRQRTRSQRDRKYQRRKKQIIKEGGV